MVRIEKGKLIIEIETRCPEADLYNLQTALIELLGRAASAPSEGYNDNSCYYGVTELLHEIKLDELEITKAFKKDEKGR